MENRLNYEKLKAEIQNLTRRMDQMEKKASMYEEQFRETSKTVQSIDFNVNLTNLNQECLTIRRYYIKE